MCPDTNTLSNQDEDKKGDNQNEDQEASTDEAVEKSETQIVSNIVVLFTQGRSRISTVRQRLSDKVTNTSYQDIINHSIISGVIGGLIFALAAPFFMPIVTDLQVNSGMVSGPEIEFEAYPGSGQETTENVSFWFKNTENRIAQDVTIDVWYRGCSVDRDISHGPERVGQTPGVELTRDNCLESIYLPNLPPGGEIVARYTYDTTKVPAHSEHINDGEIQFRVTYTWEYNGRVYYEVETTDACSGCIVTVS